MRKLGSRLFTLGPVLFACCVVLIARTATAGDYELKIVPNSDEVIFEMPEASCRPRTTSFGEGVDWPDSKGHVLRNHLGQVRIIADNNASYHTVGRTFALRDLIHNGGETGTDHACFGPTYVQDDDPFYPNYAHREWISGIYVDEEVGRHVVGLVHMEYWGHEVPPFQAGCQADIGEPNVYNNCWVNAVTQVFSSDGGQTFQKLAGSERVVASIMETYAPGQGPAVGYAGPTNIIYNPNDGWFYALVGARRPKHLVSAQELGRCLFRSAAMSMFNGNGQPNSTVPDGIWRAWGGTAFDRDLRPGVLPKQVCEPVITDFLVEGLATVNDPVSGETTFIAVGRGWQTVPPYQFGILYALSTDLINWGPPKFLKHQPGLGRVTDQTYPILVDHNSPSRNYSLLTENGNEIYLYSTVKEGSRDPLLPPLAQNWNGNAYKNFMRERVTLTRLD